MVAHTLMLIFVLVMWLFLMIIHDWSEDEIEALEAKRKDLEEKLAEAEAKLAEVKDIIKQITATSHADDYFAWDQALDAAIKFTTEMEKTE